MNRAFAEAQTSVIVLTFLVMVVGIGYQTGNLGFALVITVPAFLGWLVLLVKNLAAQKREQNTHKWEKGEKNE